MTIDETIKMYKDISNTDTSCHRYCMLPCYECEQQCRQIAEWLEDYKQIKMLVPIEQALKSEYSKGYSKAENDYYAQSEKDRQSSYDCGYNKAIDDIREKLMQNGFIYTQHALDVFNDIAEQLKAGERD